MTMKVLDPDELAHYQRLLVLAMTLVEARLPLFSATFVKHTALHFFGPGGWVERIGPSHSLWK
jgi:hypothetical protein